MFYKRKLSRFTRFALAAILLRKQSIIQTTDDVSAKENFGLDAWTAWAPWQPIDAAAPFPAVCVSWLNRTSFDGILPD